MLDIKGVGNKISHFIKKYKYAAIIILIGIVLITLPEIEKSNNTRTPEPENRIKELTTEEKLSDFLSRIEGAGQVQVMLTEASGEEILYQTNDKSSSGDNSSNKDANTVIITDESRSQNGLIRQINPPVYLGAIIACQGADDPKVQLAIVDAVSKITGLGANRISVLKMK